MESIQKAIVSSLAGGSSASSAHGPASDGTPTSSLVSRILQVALGLFVTTVDLPSLGPDLQSNPSIGFDCDFSMPCRWTSVGNSVDKWKLARGEPDSILWLAATGTMVQPVEPFSLLESRDGRLGEMLTSELVTCQDGPSMLSFTYWTVGNSDLEICLLDADFNRFNCTGMLQTHVQPGKVALRIPPVEKSFHIAIIPNREQGVLVVDDIKFDARSCQDRHRGMVLSTRSSPSPLPSHVWTINSQTALPITTATFPSPPPLLGPVSTASPLPLPFSPGPSLPMGPLILPPLLPGPTAGIVNPFVVAPLIPPTTSFAGLLTAPSPAPRTDSTSATTSSPSPPLAIIVTAGYTKKASTMAESSTEEEEEEAEEEEEQEKSSTERQSTETRRMPSTTESPIFTSTIISARTRSKFVPATATRRTKMPTGFPNIGIGTTTVKPLPSFDLLIVGNRTRPFFDRRLGKITEQTEDLLCDFANNFPCLWGPEAGRWAVVDKGAIPSLDEQYSSSEEEDESPNYPAAVVIQGTAMLSSDPLRCQSGEGKLLFRYWTNGRVLVQVCAMGWAVDSAKIQCVEEVADHNRMDPSSLAIFELPDPIREPFTLNLVPIWEKNAHNNYLLIDEIAYIGECNLTALNEIDEVESHREIGTGRRVEVPGPGTAGQAGITLLPPPVPFIPPHFTLRPASPPTKHTITTTSATTSTTSTTTMTPMTTTTTTIMEITTTISAATPSPQPPPTTITTTKASSSVEVEDLITPLQTLPPPAPSSPAPPISRSTVRPVRPRTRRPLVISPIVQPPATGQHLTRPPPRPPMPRRPVPVETASWLSTTRRPGTRYPFYPSTPTVPNQRLTTPPWGPSRELPTGTIDWITSAKPTEEFSGEELGGGGGGMVSTIYPGIDPVKKKRPSAGTTLDSFTIPYTTTQRYKPTTPPVELNYCKLLNCDFNENACHYLNHGLTRVPWTLRTKGYGFPLNRNTDLRPTAANGQFVSCVLGPGDFGILESPRFNLTDGINVLLFQYFRPTHSSTIRLCLGTRYTKPLRTVSAFLQCPPILRSVTSKNTPKWNSVHIQLPPGTSHFYLVAHNLDRSAEKTAIAIDNIRVAICDPRATYDPEDPDLTESDRRMLVPSIRKATAIVDSRELYEDLTEVNEEDTDRL